MRKINRTLMILLLASLAAVNAHAKRDEPKDVAPVTRNGVVYSAPHDKMGFVIAKDEKTGKQLWSKQVYAVKYDPDLEKDVQDCFITELRFDGEMLIVSNEEGGQFELNPAAQAVKVLKGAALIDRTLEKQK